MPSKHNYLYIINAIQQANTMSKKPDFKSISIKEEFAEAIEKFVKDHPELGYRSIAQFLEDSSRRRLEELKAQIKPLPRFEQVNSDENGVKILDRDLHKVVDVYFKPSGIRCSIDETNDCEHVHFALQQSEVKRLIIAKRKEGWKIELPE
jgi:hypothetical protein